MKECKHRNSFNGGILYWYTWVENKIKRGAKQRQCPNCKRWFFKSEYQQHFPINKSKEYIQSQAEAELLLRKLKHNDKYWVVDHISNTWVKQRYTYYSDRDEQESPERLLHWFRMGWCRLAAIFLLLISTIGYSQQRLIPNFKVTTKGIVVWRYTVPGEPIKHILSKGDTLIAYRRIVKIKKAMQ